MRFQGYRLGLCYVNLIIPEKIAGYDSAQLRSLIDFVLKTMEEVQAKKAEIYPLSEPEVGYIVPRNLKQA